MRIYASILTLCAAMSMPLSAYAAQSIAGLCTILVPPSVNPGIPFRVTVARSPTYPGQWFRPRVTARITVPVNSAIMPGPNSYNQTVVQNVDGLGGQNKAYATFVVPEFPNLVFSNVAIRAYVENVNKNGRLTRVAVCDEVTALR